LNRLKGPRVLVIALVLAAGFMATTSSLAMAEPYFKPYNEGMRWSGELSLTKNYGSEVTCKFPEAYEGEAALHSYQLTILGYSPYYLTCSNGTHLAWEPAGHPVYWEGKYSITFADALDWWGPHESPYGPYMGEAGEVAWTNPVLNSPGSIHFSKNVIGRVEATGELIRAFGTLTVTTNSGLRMWIGGS
jgi:hypothetical protein